MAIVRQDETRAGNVIKLSHIVALQIAKPST